MPGPGNPNNPANGPKNQLNLANDDLAGYVPGAFTDLEDPNLNLNLKNFKNKVVIGTDDVDWVALGDGNDQMWAGASDDIILGGEGNDVIRGEAGDDTLSGESGNDVLDGGEGDDTMDGGTGDDVYHVDSASDTVTENVDEGNDTVIWRFEGTHALPDNVENGTLHEEAGESTLTGDSGNNVLIGNSFDNEISGLGGDDTIDGGAGDDTIDGGVGDDTIDGGEGDDTIDGGDGADTLSGGAGGDIDLFDLGLSSGADEDPADTLARDNFQDTVVAQADFGANGTDNVIHYSDGQDDENTGFAFDVIDFTAFLGEDGDPNNVLFVVQSGTDTQIWEDADNDDAITNSTVDNQWFSISETPTVGGNPAENVFIQVGDDIYKWDAGGQDWDMLI